MELVLIHSPLVGPSFWHATASALEARGHRCHTPTARTASGDIAAWRDWPERIRESVATGARPILVGHSAAGRLLPTCAQKLDAAAIVFVDAPIPPAVGPVSPVEPEFLAFVRGLPIAGGTLPPWSEWWGEHAMAALIPDAGARERFAADLPRLPLEWFDDVVPVPPWRTLPAGYLQTSQHYSADTEDARERGWPVRVLHGTHLYPLTEPESTAAALAGIIESRAIADRAAATGGLIENVNATRQVP